MKPLDFYHKIAMDVKRTDESAVAQYIKSQAEYIISNGGDLRDYTLVCESKSDLTKYKTVYKLKKINDVTK